MKELGRIKLRNVVFLENQEMKRIFGGSESDVYCGGSSGACSGSCNIDGKSGSCVVRDGVCGCIITTSPGSSGVL